MDYDVKLDAIYINGTKTDIFPEDNSGANFDSEDWSLILSNLTSTLSCQIYFNKAIPTNTATCAFTNVLLILSLIAVSAFAITKIIKKTKFFKI